MNMNFNQSELDKINEDAQTASQTEDAQTEDAQAEVKDLLSEQPQMALQTMTVDQSIYAVVEPGTGPLLRSSTTTDNAKLFNALNGSSESVKQWLGEEVDVTDIVITSADVPSVMGDDDSDRVSKPCVHFFTLDGTHISSISNGIIKSTKMLLACGLTPTEDEPIRIRFKEVETKKGTAHTFEMV